MAEGQVAKFTKGNGVGKATVVSVKSDISGGLKRKAGDHGGSSEKEKKGTRRGKKPKK